MLEIIRVGWTEVLLCVGGGVTFRLNSTVEVGIKLLYYSHVVYCRGQGICARSRPRANKSVTVAVL